MNELGFNSKKVFEVYFLKRDGSIKGIIYLIINVGLFLT